MTFRQILVLKSKIWDTEKEDFFFQIKAEFEDHSHIFTVWREHNPDIYDQLKYATKNLLPEDYPIELNIRIDGVIHPIDIPNK